MKVSIIIPTRERAQYLKYSIQTALIIEDNNIEIVICDNASQDNTADVVKTFTDSRLKYVNTGARISMRENFNYALNASSGDYVIFFGDDDGILPGQFRFLRQLLEAHQPDGISWNRTTYGWPEDGYGKKTGGLRFWQGGTYGNEYAYDPKERNLDALMGSRLSALSPTTPNIYHGCVSRSYLNKIAPSPLVFFDSAIPDVNFEYRAIMTGGRFLHVRHPFSINGHSPVSTGGAHHGARSDKGGGSAGRAFTAETRADPLQDVFEHALTVPLVFFSTLETVKERMKYSGRKPEYKHWYQYGLNAERENPEATVKIEKILTEYAMRTNTNEQLELAKVSKRKSKRTFKERLKRIADQIHSFRVSTALEGENTILTAANVVDEILGEELGDVLSRQKSSKTAWRNARRRSKAFVRQL